ncbi:MAG: hypothetical protein ABEK17_01625 [Candidatus Aenigmatarchaeota archaeon]
MTKYTREVYCGELNLEINNKNGKIVVEPKMEKFGDCKAYIFIGNMITERLNSSDNKEKFIGELKQYECTYGDVGCIEAMGECLEEFLDNCK